MSNDALIFTSYSVKAEQLSEEWWYEKFGAKLK